MKKKNKKSSSEKIKRYSLYMPVERYDMAQAFMEEFESFVGFVNVAIEEEIQRRKKQNGK